MMLQARRFIAMVFTAGALSTSLAKTPGEVEVGGILRDAKMNGLTTHSRQLSAYRGKPLIINVWASWCGPCRQEMASLDRLARRYGGKQFNLIGISTDDDMESAYAFMERTSTSFDNFIDHKLVLENMLGADKLPLTVLIDADGRVLSKRYGAMQWDSPDAKKLIEHAFKIRL